MGLETSFKPGCRVTVTSKLFPAWNGNAEVIKITNFDSAHVKMLDGQKRGLIGAFDLLEISLNRLQPIDTSRTVTTIPARPDLVATAVPGATVPSSLGFRSSVGAAGVIRANTQPRIVAGIAKQIAKQLGEQNRYVTSDQVQSELVKRGYTAAQLGNAAGGLFQGGLFKRTDKTVKSERESAHGRRISVWEYVGTISSTAPSAGPVENQGKQYIVEFRNTRNGGGNWMRSGNESITFPGKNNYYVRFNSLAEAVLEASKQQEKGKSSDNREVALEYRATAI